MAVINLAALGKIAWSVSQGSESGWAVLVCDAAVYFGVKLINRKKAQEAVMQTTDSASFADPSPKLQNLMQMLIHHTLKLAKHSQN